MRILTVAVSSLLLSFAQFGCDTHEPSPTRMSGGAGVGEGESSNPTGPSTRGAATRGSNPSVGEANEQGLPERLLGTWVARDVDTKLGEVKVKLTFRDSGGMKLAAWSDIPFVGQVRDKQGPYTVDGNTISSDAIRGGTTVQYRFDSGKLIIEYKDGKTFTFTRQS